jgi:hypothetical protein
MLMDMCSKLFSLVMRARTFTLLDKHGTCFQFGGTPGVGCRDGLFTLKALLNASTQSRPSFICGLCRPRQGIQYRNHKLLIDILCRYEAPPKFATAIETIYRNNTCVLKIKNEVKKDPTKRESTSRGQHGTCPLPLPYDSLCSDS